MNLAASFYVFFLGLLIFSTSNAQSDHLSVVTNYLRGTVTVQNQPLSETERDALVSYFEDLKRDYTKSMQQSQDHFYELVTDASRDFKIGMKDLLLNSGVLHLIGINYESRSPVLQTETAIFDRTIALVQRNSGSNRDLTEIQKRLAIIKQREDIVAKSINDILQNNVHVFLIDLPFNVDESCKSISYIRHIWINYRRFPENYDVERAESRRADRLAHGIRLDEKLISFYKSTPKLICKSPSWYQINPPKSGITYDASTQTFTVVEDRSSEPSYEEFVNIVMEQINKQ